MSKLLFLTLALIKYCSTSTPTEDLLQIALNPRNFIQSLNLDNLDDVNFENGFCQLHLMMYLDQIQDPGSLLFNQNAWALKSKFHKEQIL